MLPRSFSAVVPIGTRRIGEIRECLPRSEQSVTATAVWEGIPNGSAHHWHALSQSSGNDTYHPPPPVVTYHPAGVLNFLYNLHSKISHS
jgi:hypothetical protein